MCSAAFAKSFQLLENGAAFLYCLNLFFRLSQKSNMLALIGQIGRTAMGQIGGMGRMFLFLISAFAWIFLPPTRFRPVLHHVGLVGDDSLLVVLLSCEFHGMVMGLRGYLSQRKFNAESFLGSAGA